MTNAIETVGLKKSFPVRGKKERVEAVRGVSLTVAQGEIFGFLGPNGAGKTTCQRMLTTLLPIESGTAAVAGFDVRKKPHEVRKHIGYVSQLGGADLPATGRENLMLAGRLYGLPRGEVEQKIDALAALLDLNGLLDRIVRTYSGGQKRRLEVGLGILHEPAILFMDEPTTGLDPQNRANLWTHIRKLKENGMT
ncbi:MAG: ATP-binding cassette domain-containing protein, partial [Oscillospiraceae bacterium]|nr:ATP-binding cassette domain-containing protein [Oscillospiraceae bacterium]